MMVKKYEVREVGDGPSWLRWLATFRERDHAEVYSNRLWCGGYSKRMEIVEVWDDA